MNVIAETIESEQEDILLFFTNIDGGVCVSIHQGDNIIYLGADDVRELVARLDRRSGGTVHDSPPDNLVQDAPQGCLWLY